MATKKKFKKIMVLGLGKVGTLVALLLKQSGFEPVGFDAAESSEKGFKSEVLDVKNKAALKAQMSKHDALISCLPFHLNKAVAKCAHETGIHYFDLTEDVETTKLIMKLAKTSKGVMVPQCGLAPGIIGIIASSLAKKFNGPVRSIEMRVGALPKHPTGSLGYAFNWSADGVVNEYIKECDIIRDGSTTVVPPLEMLEALTIDGVTYEAFTTSGGLGTMCETYNGKVKSLDYKSIRYVGHCRLMRFLLNELHLNDRPKLAAEILEHAKPPTPEDFVYVHASVVGEMNGKLRRDEFVRRYEPIKVANRMWTAIAWTTAASAVAVIEMVAGGTLPAKGFVRQEDIDLDDFSATKCGAIYTKNKTAV